MVKLYSPFTSVITPIVVFLTETVAPIKGAPDLSVTLPFTVLCAKAIPGKTANSIINKIRFSFKIEIFAFIIILYS